MYLPATLLRCSIWPEPGEMESTAEFVCPHLTHKIFCSPVAQAQVPSSIRSTSRSSPVDRESVEYRPFSSGQYEHFHPATGSTRFGDEIDPEFLRPRDACRRTRLASVVS